MPAGTLFDGGVGYISLNPVAETSADELRQEIGAMKGKGMKSLILDLRLNPGGLLDQGVKVADLFLDSKQEIVATRGRARGSTKEFFDEARQAWPELPIVVLGERRHRQRRRDHRGRAAGSRPRRRGRYADLRQGPGADAVSARRRGGAQADHGPLVHAERPDHSADREERGGRRPSRRRLEAGDTMPGAPDKEHTDSAIQQRPIFHTDAGRIVRGGGGIVPDLVIRPDTLTGGEQEFAKALGSQLPEYRDVLTTYALEPKKTGTIKSETSRSRPRCGSRCYRRLKQQGRRHDAGGVRRRRAA